ncbi:hypothetical protein RhiJN_16490 [Ceratobasidium sp. AG-Ba]|nr:hypothetical protein RhiJN_16490 [Ceratobasidium sp. AG-Ba]
MSIPREPCRIINPGRFAGWQLAASWTGLDGAIETDTLDETRDKWILESRPDNKFAIRHEKLNKYIALQNESDKPSLNNLLYLRDKPLLFTAKQGEGPNRYRFSVICDEETQDSLYLDEFGAGTPPGIVLGHEHGETVVWELKFPVKQKYYPPGAPVVD